MRDGEYVTLETNICPVCGKEWETGIVLLDRRLKNSFKHQYTVTGYDLCPEHQKYVEDGYVFILEVENSSKDKNIIHSEEGMQLEYDDAAKTGRVLYMPKYIAEQVFPTVGIITFVDTETFDALNPTLCTD